MPGRGIHPFLLKVSVLLRVVDDEAVLAFQGDVHDHDAYVDEVVQDGYHGYDAVVLDEDHFDDDDGVDDEIGDALYSVLLVDEGDNYYFGYY